MRTFIKALIVVIIVSLLLAGVVYAYQTIWSGKAQISIEPTTGAGQFEITNITANKGTWNGSTETWTVSIPQGGSGALCIRVKNIGSGLLTINGNISNENPVAGVLIRCLPQAAPPGGCQVSLVAGGSADIIFDVTGNMDAQVGQIPEVQLELRQQ